ncbi:hypothetical protein DIS24_g5078 [Lasiodiplodia hormozganensis]|uniref:Uncharacterized protein n=1 Tax=Lasiodiplodia hormozganensis TaxID=869390 RepID=A0AA40CX22_9PEZI|nr:hypothetical protein DIS24_g5078 [Lasiodiplodia hormozganensis]
MRPGYTHREPFDLDFEKVYFGKLIHIDRIEGEPWTDRPAIVTGVNEDSRRVRFFTVYSFGEAGGLRKRFSNLRHQQEAEKEHNMRNFILIENEQLAARPHLGTPVVRLKGEQLTKSCWVNTAEVRELPFDRVCAQSIGHTLNEAWLPLDQMRILRGHVQRQGNSLFPSEKDGRLERYDGGWCGYREYEKEGLGETRN